jgi:DNA-binding NarL/FixJ family response regulator
MAEHIRLFIAEQNDITRTLLVELLDELDNLQVVGSSLDGNETLRYCEQLQPDALLVSSRLNTVDGVTTARLLREKNSFINIILLSSGLEECEAKSVTAVTDATLMLEEVTIPVIEQCLKRLQQAKRLSGSCSPEGKIPRK